MANDTLKDLIYFLQKMGIHSDIDLSKTIEPYGTYDSALEMPGEDAYMEFMTYNPYDKEIAIKDAKLGDKDAYDIDTAPIKIYGNISSDIKFLNGKVDSHSTFDEWTEAFKEEAENILIWNNGEEQGEEPEDEYANVLWCNYKDDDKYIYYYFRLDDGREVCIWVDCWGDYVPYICFFFKPQYE